MDFVNFLAFVATILGLIIAIVGISRASARQKLLSAVIATFAVLYALQFFYLGPKSAGDGFISGLQQLNASQLLEYSCSGSSLYNSLLNSNNLFKFSAIFGSVQTSGESFTPLLNTYHFSMTPHNILAGSEPTQSATLTIEPKSLVGFCVADFRLSQYPNVLTNLPGNFKMVPSGTKWHGKRKNGWKSLDINFAVGNQYPDWRIFGMGVRAGGVYSAVDVQVTSAESRTQGQNWMFSGGRYMIVLPPGFMIRQEYGANIKGEVPENVTDLKATIPIYVSSLTDFPGNDNISEPNSSITVDIDDEDFKYMIRGEFPIFDQNLAALTQISNNFSFDAVKTNIDVSFHKHEENLRVDFKVTNSDQLNDLNVSHIEVFGAGHDGILRSVSHIKGSACGIGLHLAKLGPNQYGVCQVVFTEVPYSTDEFYIWFIVHKSEQIVGQGVSRFSH
jgi:hypothetical protein